MTTDIRLDVTMPANPKTKRLIRLLGDHGFACVIRLWAFAGAYRQEGILTEMLDDDIEEAAGWRGDKGTFVSTLADEAWLDKQANGEYSLHSWSNHQPWIVNAKKRSAIARENASKAWETRRRGKRAITAIPVDPPPKDEGEKKSPAFEDLLPIRQIIAYLNEKSGKNFSPTSRTTKAHVSARWKEGYGLEDFKKVIDYQVAKWKGDPKMEEYLRPQTLFNGEKFEAYLNAPPPGENQPKGTDTAGRPLEDLPS